MKELPLLAMFVAVLAVCAATAAQAAQIEVCHLPPGNPAAAGLTRTPF
jgi:hypothetical protein